MNAEPPDGIRSWCACVGDMEALLSGATQPAQSCPRWRAPVCWHPAQLEGVQASQITSGSSRGICPRQAAGVRPRAGDEAAPDFLAGISPLREAHSDYPLYICTCHLPQPAPAEAPRADVDSVGHELGRSPWLCLLSLAPSPFCWFGGDGRPA